MSDYETLDQKLNAEILENKRLREALEKYGRHLNDENQFCRSYMHSAYKCDCGFDDVLKGGAK